MAPISKGTPWGSPGALPPGGVVVDTDGAASAVLEEARREGRPLPAVGLLGGDLCRTLGGGHRDAAELRSPEAVSFTVDLGEALIDGRLHLFVAHLVARGPRWRRVWAACNAQWRRDWYVAPRAHPNDGLLDVYEAELSIADRLRARRRLSQGTHLPHPAIHERRVAAAQVSFERPMVVELDGRQMGRARNLSVRLEPDALTVVI